MRITERILSIRIGLFPNVATHPDLGNRTWLYLPYLPYTTSPTPSYPIPPYPVPDHPHIFSAPRTGAERNYAEQIGASVLNCSGKVEPSVLKCQAKV